MDKLRIFLKEAYKNANLYDKKRPNYTNEAVQYVSKRIFKSQQNDIAYNILELGCGIGKFTTSLYPLLPKDVKYLATDALPDPLLTVKEKLPKVDIQVCTASCIPLPDASVENIICEMSFHWFANKESLTEMNRVLMPEGRILLIFYYPPFGYEFTMKMYELLEGYLDPTIPRHYKRSWKPIFDSFEQLKLIEHCFLKGARIEDPQTFSLDFFWSSGISSVMSEEEKSMALSKLQTLIEQTDTSTTFELDTEFYCVEKAIL